jgi:hypothetical protein
MLGIGAAIMLYVQFRGQVGLLQHAAGDLSSPPPTSFADRGPATWMLPSSRHRVIASRGIETSR